MTKIGRCTGIQVEAARLKNLNELLEIEGSRHKHQKNLEIKNFRNQELKKLEIRNTEIEDSRHKHQAKTNLIQVIPFFILLPLL